VVSLALTQSDKIVLSRTISLKEFGYYGIAASVAGTLAAIAQPVFAAVFPRLSQRVAAGDPAAEAGEYHRASQLLSVLLFPVATVLACSSHALLLAWTGKPEVADHAWLPSTMLVVGACLNGVMHIPFALMLAHGWTRLPLVTNIVAVVVLVPLLVWACDRFGAPGAASMWCVLNAGYVLIQIPLMHARLVPGEMMRWYVRDLAMPLAGAAAGALVAAVLIPAADGRVLVMARFAAMISISAVAAASLAPEVRRPLLAKLRR
jgi:O-antigen/teichoic acid export membrane protein